MLLAHAEAQTAFLRSIDHLLQAQNHLLLEIRDRLPKPQTSTPMVIPGLTPPPLTQVKSACAKCDHGFDAKGLECKACGGTGHVFSVGA